MDGAEPVWAGEAGQRDAREGQQYAEEDYHQAAEADDQLSGSELEGLPLEEVAQVDDAASGQCCGDDEDSRFSSVQVPAPGG